MLTNPLEQALQFHHSLRVFGSEIIPLADILNEIEQLGWLIIIIRIAVFLFPGFNFIVSFAIAFLGID